MAKTEKATQEEKVKAFLDMFGDVAESTLKTADANHHTAEEVFQLAFKETDSDLSIADRLLEAAIKVKEAEMEMEAAKAKKRKPPVEEPDLDEDEEEEDEEMEDEDEYPVTKKEFRAAMAELKTYWDKKTSAASTKEADTAAALAEVSDAHTGRIAKLEKTVKEFSGLLATAKTELAELAGDRPPVATGGVRPSQSPDNVVEKEAVMQQPPQYHPNGELQEFFSFIGGNMNGGQ